MRPETRKAAPAGAAFPSDAGAGDQLSRAIASTSSQVSLPSEEPEVRTMPETCAEEMSFNAAMSAALLAAALTNSLVSA